MSDLVKATETFAWSGGLVHWGSEWPSDDAAVKAFPQFFEPVVQDAPVKRIPRVRGGRNG